MEDWESEYVDELTRAQPPLFAYICMLLGNTHDANDILQETNRVLWSKASEFERGSNFMAWAREIAYYKALSHFRDKKRSRILVDQEKAEAALARRSPDYGSDERRVALRHCLAGLGEDERELLRMRYTNQVRLSGIAANLGKSEAAVKMALLRVRQGLMACIRRRLAMEP